MRNLFLALLGLCTAWLSSHGQTSSAQAYTSIGIISSESEGFVYLETPMGAAVDAAGNVYVADSSQDRVFKFDANGQFLFHWGASGTENGQFDQPVDVAIGSDGSVFVLEAGNVRVQKFDTDGDFLLGFGGPQENLFLEPRALAADAQGNLFVLETGFVPHVQQFGLNGNFLNEFGGPTFTGGAFVDPQGLAVTADGRILVADCGKQRLIEFASSGELIQEIAAITNGVVTYNFSGPKDIEISAAGDVFVVDALSTGNRIYRMDGSYSFLEINFGQATPGNTSIEQPTSLAIDTSGNRLYLTDAQRGKLIRYSLGLNFVIEFGTNMLSGIGQLGRPGGVAIGPGNRIYISDPVNGDIKIYDSDLSYSGTTLPGAVSGEGTIEQPGPLAVNDDGDIYVLEGERSLKRFRPDGTLIQQNVFGTDRRLKSIYLEPDGNFWVTLANLSTDPPQGGVRQFAEDLSLLSTQDFSNGLILPCGITRDANGNLIIADSSRNNVFVFDRNTFIPQFGFSFPEVAPTRWGRPQGIVRDRRGNILITDRQNHRILKYRPDGTFLSAYGSLGSKAGEFNEPFQIATDDQGRIYVAEAGNRRIQVLENCEIITTETAEICAGEEFVFEGLIYRETGIYDRVFVSKDGCDSIVRLDLTVLPPIETNIDSVICEGEQVDFLNTLLTQSGVYRDTFVADNGCDSTVILNLEVAPNYTIDTTLSICSGGSYLFGDQTLTMAGAYSFTFMSSAGCDSTVMLTLQVSDTIRTMRTDTICQGDTLQIGDQSFFASGMEEVVFPADGNRCDSIVTVQLTVLDTFRTVRFDTICQGEELAVGDSLLSTTDIHEVVFPPTTERCDSVVEVHLTVLDTFRTMRFDTICRGDSLVVDTFSFFEPDIYELVYPRNEERCDSVVELHLTVLDTFLTQRFDTICTGEQLTIGDQMFSRQGVYEVVFPRTTGRCDSTVQLHLTVFNTFETVRSDTICQGDTLRIGDARLFEPGAHEVVFPRNQQRCDSTVIVELTVLDTFRTIRFDTICGGESLQIGDSIYTESGVYEYVFPPNGERCDSTVEVNLHVRPAYREVNMVTICQGDTFRVEGRERSTSGQIVFPGQTREGCDSTIIYEVQVLPRFAERLDTSICIGEQLSIGNARYASSGIFFYTFPPTATRCDSTVEIHLTVKDTFDMEATETICRGDTVVFGDRQLFEPGDYRYTFPENERRCDSTVALRLNVLEHSFDTLNLTLCPSNVLFIGSTRINGPGTYDSRLTAANGCDSLIHIQVTERPPRRTFLERRVCEADGYFFGGRLLTQNGTYRDTLRARNGCDSIIQLQLTVDPTLVSRTERSICEGESVSFSGRTIRQSGLYRDSFLAQTGCYFFLELDLTVHPVFADTTFAQICAGQSFTFENEQFSEQGVFALRYQTEAGCDSVRYLNLTVEQAERTFLEETICAGDTVFWQNRLLTREGNYLDTLQTVEGCDSVLSFYLQVIEPTVDTVALEICGQEVYNFGSYRIDSSGTYTDTLTNRLGCDSIVTLEVTFEEAPPNLVTVGGVLMSANIENARYQWVNCRDTSAIPGATTQYFIPEVNGTYAVIIETEDCTYLSNCFDMNVGVTSTAEVDISEQIGLYPNPVYDQFHLALGSWGGRLYDWSVVDIRGRRVAGAIERLQTGHTMEVGAIPPGLYWLTLRTEDGHVARLRFVKTGQ